MSSAFTTIPTPFILSFFSGTRAPELCNQHERRFPICPPVRRLRPFHPHGICPAICVTVPRPPPADRSGSALGILVLHARFSYACPRIDPDLLYHRPFAASQA